MFYALLLFCPENACLLIPLHELRLVEPDGRIVRIRRNTRLAHVADAFAILRGES